MIPSTETTCEQPHIVTVISANKLIHTLLATTTTDGSGGCDIVCITGSAVGAVVAFLMLVLLIIVIAIIAMKGSLSILVLYTASTNLLSDLHSRFTGCVPC